MFFTLSKTLSSVTGPWFWTAVFVVLAALLFRRSKAASIALAAFAASLPLLFASPRVAGALQRLAESSARDTSRSDVQYDAVVVLGGGDDRIAAAGAVFRQGRARYVLYSGAISAWDARHARARLWAAGVPDDHVVIDDHSRNTRENAVQSSRIIAARGWRTLLLVTSAAHVDRALGCFHDVGLNPDVLPVERLSRQRFEGWMPRKEVVPATRAALHELIGRIMYRVVGYTG